MIQGQDGQRLMTLSSRVAAGGVLAMAGIVAYHLIWAWNQLWPATRASSKMGFSIIWLTVAAATVAALQLFRIGSTPGVAAFLGRLVLAIIAFLLLLHFDANLRGMFTAGSGAAQ